MNYSARKPSLGGDPRQLGQSVRFGVSKINTEQEIDYVTDRFVEVVERLRARTTR